MKDGCHYDKATKTYFGNNYHFSFTIIYIDDIQKWFNQYTDKLTQNHKGQGHSKWEDFFRGSRITETFGKYQHSPFDGKHYGVDFALPKVHQLKRRRMVK